MKKVLLLIVIVCVMVLVGCENTQKPIETANETSTNEVINEDVELVSKIDDNKEWVYKADYENDVDKTSYELYDHTYRLEDIKVPFININSEDATNANKEIKQTYDTAIEAFKEGLVDEMTYVDECDYKNYENNNVISVLTTLGIGATDVVHPIYNTYNFDLKTGNLMTFDEVVAKSNIIPEELDEKVKNTIDKYLDLILDNFIGDMDVESLISSMGMSETRNKDDYQNGPDFLKSIAFENYKEITEANKVRCYLDSLNKLHMVITIFIPAGSGSFDTLLVVE